MLRLLISFILCLLITPSFAVTSPVQPLPPDKAFQFSSYLNQNNQLLLEWKIAPGYYLYKEKLHVTPEIGNEIPIKDLKLPRGKIKKDDVFGTYQVYFGHLKIPLLLGNANKGKLNILVNYQGCSSHGFCYAMQKRAVQINMAQKTEAKNVIVTSQMPTVSQQQYAESVLDAESNLVVILTFLGLGLLLAFTPCVLPMIPILSGIILGHKHLTTAKAFFLSLLYVLGMALTYAVAGVIVALIGSRIQTVFQSTWAIIFVSGVFILLALSLFGFYELELPSRWTRRLMTLSNRQKGGTYFGVFLMGVLSSLIVSPCVSAPLVGVLTYIADSGNIVLGGFALLALGIGMGIPLLLVGVSAGKFLPKSGPWMESIKKLFGIILLGVAIYILSRIIPGPLALFLWAILLICTAMFMGVFSEAKTNTKKIIRGLALVLLIYGVILMIGAVLGNSNPLRPWEGSKLMASRQPTFTTIKSMEDLEDTLATAKRERKWVMIDFFADWCSSCIRLEHTIFSKMGIQSALSNFVLLKADVTKNNAFDQALLKRFNVIAPPTFVFFDADGEELVNDRIVGEVNENEFLTHIQQLKLI